MEKEMDQICDEIQKKINFMKETRKPQRIAPSGVFVCGMESYRIP